MAASACIALGSNLGDRRALIASAIRALAETPGVDRVRASRLYETPPVGGPSGQGPFLNAAAVVETTLGPLALHSRLVEIERELGRIRADRWGERAIDLDVLLFGDLILDTPELTIPHPRMAVRRFVLVPLAEIAPEAVDPLTSRCVRSLLESLDRRPGCVVLWGGLSEDRRVFDRLLARLPSVGWLDRDKGPESFAVLADVLANSVFDDVLRIKARHFDLDTWTESLADGRWLVTDFDFSQIDQIGSWASGSLFRDDPFASQWGKLSRRERFLSVRDRVIRPTFLAATAPAEYGFGRIWRESQTDPMSLETPFLWPGAGDPWPIYQATQAALNSDLPLPLPSDDEIDEMVSGIVSACEASRTETRVVAS